MVKRLIGIVTVSVLVVAALGGYAHAQFDELIPTKIGLVKFGGNPAVGKLYKIVSKAPKTGPLFALPSSSPATTGGTLTVTMGTGTLSCTLAPGLFTGTVGWKELGSPAGSKGYKYINKLAPTGDPCKIVIVKQKVIKVLAKGTGTLPAPLASGNPDVGTVLTLGTDDYCALWPQPHFKEKQDRLIKAKNQQPPGGCPSVQGCFVDNGDGTISDTCTGLMWEKKDDAGGMHDYQNQYSWTDMGDGDCTNQDGTAFTVFLPKLNNTCDGDESTPCTTDGDCTEIGNGLCGHAGYRDWRLPEVNRDGGAEELETILYEPYPCSLTPCVDPVFHSSCTEACTVTTCSCTAAQPTWSAIASASDPPHPCDAWGVHFHYGTVALYFKPDSWPVRAVRGGSPSAAFLDVTEGVLD